uniref:Uncharacterized protein n=1 Tax=Anopheles farauti TaxID=69004 RepID=A0A182QAC9_9DIPT
MLERRIQVVRGEATVRHASGEIEMKLVRRLLATRIEMGEVVALMIVRFQLPVLRRSIVVFGSCIVCLGGCLSVRQDDTLLPMPISGGPAVPPDGPIPGPADIIMLLPPAALSDSARFDAVLPAVAAVVIVATVADDDPVEEEEELASRFEFRFTGCVATAVPTDSGVAIPEPYTPTPPFTVTSGSFGGPGADDFDDF